MPTPWMIDELAHAGPEHLDEAFVAGFDRKQGHPHAGPDIAEFEKHGPDASSVVVELGAGTGQFTLPAARAFGRVVAADVSPAMLAHLRAKVPASVTVVRAGFLSYAHEGPPADGVYTRHALHQLPDFFKAIALHRIAGMLRPGGVLRVRDLIYDAAPAEAAEVVESWLATAAADPADGYTVDDRAEHVRTEYGTYRWLFEPMLTAAGFDIVDVSYRERLYGAYTCVKR
ncbi:class I SAM-dependent methyltransferase [Virgisporangium aurantiacum]